MRVVPTFGGERAWMVGRSLGTRPAISRCLASALVRSRRRAVSTSQGRLMYSWQLCPTFTRISAQPEVLLGLVLRCDRAGVLGQGWTRRSLGASLGIGDKTFDRSLTELADKGLLAYRVRQGQKMSLAVLALPALVAITALPPMPPRDKRRALARNGAHAAGEAHDLAARVLRQFGILEPPKEKLVAPLGAALAQGMSAAQILEGVVAGGTLAGLTDVQAGLGARALRFCTHLAEVRREAANRHTELRAKQARREELTRLEQESWASREAEDRGVASAILHLPTAAVLGLHPLTSGPMPHAMAILATCRELVAAHPDLDPSALIARWAGAPGRPEEFYTAGIPPRAGGTPGTLPQARTGPTLLERLRAGP